MTARKTNKLQRQSAMRRLSLFLHKQRSLAWPRAKWRAKSWQVFSIKITIRKFKTNPAKRSGRYKQLIIRTPLLIIKEIAIVSQKPKRTRAAQALAGPLIIALIGLSGTLFFGWQLGTVQNLEPVTASALPAPEFYSNKTKPAGLERSLPLSLDVPSVDITANIMSVARNADNTIEVPPLFEHITGWYELGPSPGEIGPAVVVGHVNTYKGPSVFWRLREIVPGDEIEIVRKDGQTVTFRVNKVKQFDQDNFPTEAVYGDIDHAGLRLITCGGTFSTQSGRYSHNTIVFASVVPAPSN